MVFDPKQYGPDIERILSLGQNGNRLIPLNFTPYASPEARDLINTFSPSDLFPNLEEPEAPLAGLWLYFSCFEEAHKLAEMCETEEGDLWHALIHRHEGDSGNAAYWFRRAGPHPIFTHIARAVVKIIRRYPTAEFRTGRWDPLAFLAFCDRARKQPGSIHERVAMEIQRAEWQILFDYTARPQ
jgi:hypothetical protein